MNILFVCKYNVFRSRVAEVLFRKLNKNKSIYAKSAGIFTGQSRDSSLYLALRKKKLDLYGGPKSITVPLLKWQDMIVIVADDVPKEIFTKNNKYAKKVIVWKILDVKSNKVEERVEIINKIENKVRKLTRELEYL